jgi:V/A-type H+-transporting ATPase subunit I
MIAKMEKVSIVTLETRRNATLKALRKLGAVHLEPCVDSTDTLQELTQKRDLLEKALNLLPGKKLSGALGKPEDLGKAMQTAAEIVRIRDRMHSLDDERDRLGKEAETLEPWGTFLPADIAKLESAGIFIGLYTATPKDLSIIPPGTLLFRVGEKKKKQYLAAVFRSAEDRRAFPLEEVPLPVRGLSEIRELIEQKGDEIRRLQKTLESLAPCREEIAKSLAEMQEQVEFEQARVSMKNEGSLAHISGFIPAARTASLKKTAAEEGWAILVREPAEEDMVPTLIQNPKAIRIIQPIFGLLGTVPGYREKDISFFFLVFFSIFFAMIIGDGGYGLIILAVSLLGLARAKGGKAQEGMTLILVMSVCSIIWGALTGTLFGIQRFA